MPRPPRGCGVLHLLTLLELEFGRELRAVLGFQRHLVAAARCLGRLPVEDELAVDTRGSGVTEAGAAGGVQLDVVSHDTWV